MQDNKVNNIGTVIDHDIINIGVEKHMRINKEDSLVMIVDYQEKLMPFIDCNEEILERACVLLKGLELLEVPMMVTRQYPKGLGDTITTIKELTKGAPIYDKIAFSCYVDEAIKKAVKDSGKKNIIICGIEAHVCILQTLIDLQEDGFQVILVEDCISSRKANDKEIALIRGRAQGAYITTTESILFELLKYAGTDVFKQISKLVK